MSEKLDRLDAFIKECMEHNHIEAKIVRKIIRALKAAGNPVVSVFDFEEDVPVRTEREIFREVFNLDESYLRTKSGAYIWIVLGNEWDCIIDYNVSLEDTLKPINEWIEKHW